MSNPMMIGPSFAGNAKVYDFAFEEAPAEQVRLFVAGDATHWHIELRPANLVTRDQSGRLVRMIEAATNFAIDHTVGMVGTAGKVVEL